MSSRDAVALAGELARVLGRELPATLLWETPTVDALVTLLTSGTVPGSPQAVREPRQRTDDEPVAVVGVGSPAPRRCARTR